MERIVQLNQRDYDKLKELATLSEEQIEKRATELWGEKGIADITIKIDMGTDYCGTYRIDCKSYMFYNDNRFRIPSELRERFSKIVKEEVMWNIEEKFGGLVKAINVFKQRRKSLENTKYITWGIAASGWAAFVAYICLK